MKKAFKSLKSWKFWIVIALVVGFLAAYGVVVYAGVGLFYHDRSNSNCSYWNALSADEWDMVMRRIDSLNYIATPAAN